MLLFTSDVISLTIGRNNSNCSRILMTPSAILNNKAIFSAAYDIQELL